jgi:hypothetical protein
MYVHLWWDIDHWVVGEWKLISTFFLTWLTVYVTHKSSCVECLPKELSLHFIVSLLTKCCSDVNTTAKCWCTRWIKYKRDSWACARNIDTWRFPLLEVLGEDRKSEGSSRAAPLSPVSSRHHDVWARGTCLSWQRIIIKFNFRKGCCSLAGLHTTVRFWARLDRHITANYVSYRSEHFIKTDKEPPNHPGHTALIYPNCRPLRIQV